MFYNVHYVIHRINDLTNCLRECAMKCCQSSSSFHGRFPSFPIPPFLSIQTIWWIGIDILKILLPMYCYVPFYLMLWIWWDVMPVAQSPSADKLLLSCNTELSFSARSKWPVQWHVGALLVKYCAWMYNFKSTYPFYFVYSMSLVCPSSFSI